MAKKAKVFIIINRRTVTEKWEVRGCKTAAQAEKAFLDNNGLRDIELIDEFVDDEQLIDVRLERDFI
jgi:hypothetical protein